MEIGFVMDLSALLLLGLIWLGIVLFLRVRKKKDLVYLLFFTIFYIYIGKVLDYTLFQFQSLLILKHFMSGLILNGQTTERSMNLVPLVALTLEDMKTSLLNILLMIPFGFGLPFITSIRMKRIVVVGSIFSIVIELLQLLTALIGKITFRVVDVNDVIFNTFGVAIGYILFVGFLRVYRQIFPDREKQTNPILRYISERSQ